MRVPKLLRTWIATLDSVRVRWMLERRTPGQAFEAGIVAVRGDPFASEFYREGGEPSILGNISIRLGLLTNGLKDRPMPVTRHDDRGVGLLQQRATKFEYIFQ